MTRKCGTAYNSVRYGSFDELPSRYVALLEEFGSASFECSMMWFKNLIRTTLAEKEMVRIYGIELNDTAKTPVAALATRYHNVQGGMLSTRRLSSLSNYYTPLFSPIVRDSGSSLDEIMGELARVICHDSPPWDVIDLKPLDPDSEVFAKCVEYFSLFGMVVQTYFCFGNWYLQVKGQSYREYFETLPSTMKNTLRRKERKLRKSGVARIQIVTDRSDLEIAIKGYEEVYKESWKIPEPYPLFIPRLMKKCAEMGWLRLGLVYVDNEPVATQLWIVNENKAAIYKLAYKQRFSHLSVGSLLTARLMEHVIDIDRVQEVDYLSGDDSYKRNWMSHRRERWGIMALNPRTVKGSLGIVRHVGGRAIKRALPIFR